MNTPPCQFWARVGSFHLGDPSFHDKDFLMLAYPHDNIEAWLAENAWKPCVSVDYMQSFKAYRKDCRNIIVVSKESEFYGFMAAFYLCKKYKVFNKPDRVLIHEAMRRRNYTPCDFTVDNSTKEFKISAAFNSDKDQQAY